MLMDNLYDLWQVQAFVQAAVVSPPNRFALGEEGRRTGWCAVKAAEALAAPVTEDPILCLRQDHPSHSHSESGSAAWSAASETGGAPTWVRGAFTGSLAHRSAKAEALEVRQ